VKNLIKNHWSGGWNLIEIIVAVAIGASIAAAGVVAYQGEAKKAAVAKAKQFVSQVETKKALILADILAGSEASLPSGSDLDRLVLTSMTVSGRALTGVIANDAPALGFALISIGSLDTFDPDSGDMNRPGEPASVTLNDGTIIAGGAGSRP